MSSTERKQNIPARTRIPLRWRDNAVLIALIAFVVFGLIGLAAATGWQETLAQISKLNWVQMLGLLALSLVNYGLRAIRWHIFSRRLGLNLSFKQNGRHFFGGLAMVVTPGRLGELIRMRWLARETGWSFAKTAPLLLVDRASDLAAMALILAVTLSLSTSEITGAAPMAVLALGAALVATRPRLLAGAAGIGYAILGRGKRLFARIRTAARSLSCFSDFTTVTVSTLIGVVGWLAEAAAFYLLLKWLGADIGFATAGAIFIFSTLAGGLTGAPGGIGGAEAVMIALLSLEGLGLEVSLPATAIIRLTTLWFAIAIGVFVFPIAERHSKMEQNALEEI
ncbi:MAG: flippase-like domain-containing protein [Marinosulfonomonas sp.]|nr:flippase-like domain-containing protein [Marinosulfonomonas sp.]